VPGVGSSDRIVVPKAGVDAPITVSAVAWEDDQMATPQGPDEVLFYDFREIPGAGGYPGVGGNSIFAGHLDFGKGPCKDGTLPPPCPGVFWDLHKLSGGDLVELQIDGQRYSYAVIERFEFEAEGDPDEWMWLLMSTRLESVTLITCSGNFNVVTKDYSHRLIIRAIRV
jgi:sortase (surface protein transpeptidase)